MELLSKSEGRNSPYLTLGKVVSPHGLRGALKVYSLSDFPERFLDLEEVYLLTDPDADSAQGPFRVENVQPFKGRIWLFFLEEIADRSAAEALGKPYLALPAADALDLPEDTFYARDLIGFEVVDTQGMHLGSVTQLIQSHQDLIVLTTDAGSEHWIPFVKELVPEVDVAGKRLVLNPIQGLLE